MHSWAISYILLLSVILISGCTIKEGKQVDVQKAAEPAEQAEVVRTEQPQVPQFRPVSLPVFAQRTFSGTDFTVGKVLAENSAYTRYYITYKSGQLLISGIMNVPKGDGPFPVLILNHGYIDSGVYTNGRGLKREQDYLARRGYVVVHPDYRNHADSDDDPDAELSLRLGYSEDVINAIGAIKNAGMPYVDTERIGMLGHSMGGGIAQNILVTRPDLVTAVVLFAPVSSDYRENFNRWTRRRQEVAEKIVALYGTPTSSPVFWANVSARTFFDKVETPVLIHHGTADKDVPIAWSEATVKALQNLGKEVTFYTYPGEPHEFTKAWPLVMQRTVQFFDTYLKLTPS